MKAINRVWLILGLIGALACGGALADPAARHGRPHGGWHRGSPGGWHGGVIIGAPLFWPYYGVPYAAYQYGYAPLIVEQPEYVEQGQERDAAPPLWYFCKDPKGYYPYVKQCPSGWHGVVPPAPSPN